VEYQIFTTVNKNRITSENSKLLTKDKKSSDTYLLVLEKIHEELTLKNIKDDEIYEYVDLVQNISICEVAYREFDLIGKEHNRNLNMIFEVFVYGILCKFIKFLK
jgi:hypothetical protein